MSGKERLDEFLKQKLAGYESDLPVGDLPEFKKKMFNNIRQIRRKLIFTQFILTLSLLLSVLFNFNDHLFNSKNNNLTYDKTSTLKEQLNSNQKTNSTYQKNTSVQSAHIINKLSVDNQINSTNKTHTQLSNKVATKGIAVQTEPVNSGKSNPLKLDSANNKKNAFLENNLLIKAKYFYFDLMKKDYLKPQTGVISNKTSFRFLRPRHFIMLKLVFSPSYTSQTYDIDETSSPKVHENYETIKDKSEKGGFGYSSGINLEYGLKRNFSVAAGLIYQSFQIINNYDFKNNKIPVIDSATRRIVGYITIKDSLGTQYNTVVKNNYVQIPVIVTFRLLKFSNFDIHLKAGGNYIYQLSSSGKTLDPTYLKLNDVSMNQYNRSNLGLILGAGCNYTINGIYSIGIEPVWNRFLLQANNHNQLVNLHPWSMSLNLSLMLKL